MNNSPSQIKWNNEVKLIVSDVDETIADLYVKAEPEMIRELTQLLKEGKALFFVTGQGLKSVQWRIIDPIPQQLRSLILVGHCSGAEVWGHLPLPSVITEKLGYEPISRDCGVAQCGEIHPF